MNSTREQPAGDLAITLCSVNLSILSCIQSYSWKLICFTTPQFLRVKKQRRAKDAAPPSTNSSIYEVIEALYAHAKVQLSEGSYQTHADPGMEACLKELPWWKDVTLRLGSSS